MLVCHALTGDQYVAEPHPLTGKPGWWDSVVGPGRPVDTDRFFVICANVLGGCMGSTGPRSPRADGGGPWGTDFPTVTIRDMVRAQQHADRAARHPAPVRGDRRLDGRHAGAAMGGELSRTRCSPRSRSPRRRIHSAQNIAFHEVGRQAIFADPDWEGGALLAHRQGPGARPGGGADVRAHHLSERAGADPQIRPPGAQHAPKDAAEAITLFGDMFEVESYLRHQGSTFVNRFDANSYLTITRAMDYFDLAADHDGDLAGGVPRHPDAVPAGLVRQRLAVPDRGKPRASRGR